MVSPDQVGPHTPIPSSTSLTLRYPGKTTLSITVTAALNARYAASNPGGTASPLAAFVPMDGYHLTRAQLDAMPDPTTAHARRGAEFTFDGSGFLKLVQTLREPITEETGTILAPSFDHAIKDPKEDDIAVAPTQRIVVFEGNCKSSPLRPRAQNMHLPPQTSSLTKPPGAQLPA